jgi:tetratricopeptide (TPR) repeat protein
VSLTPPQLRHLAFFDALAETDENDSSWPAISAGLVVLRLLDSYLEDGPSALEAWGLRAVRDAVQAVRAGDPARAILGGIIDAIEAATGPAAAALAPRLMAYGRALDYDGRFRLAADVYRTVIAHVHPQEDADVVSDAHIQLGYCARMMGEYDESKAAYTTAAEIAATAGDLVKVLRARMAEAKLALTRGNLPEAEGLLEATLTEATERRLGEVQATALHISATVAHARGDYERAIRLAYQSLDGFSSPAMRDRALADVAAAFAELGVRTAARDAHLILAATAQEQYSRWVATINLLEIAALDRAEPVFEQYRRELAGVALPPYLEAAYHLYVGEGLRGFGRIEAARDALTRAIDVAARHRLNQLLFRAEQALREMSIAPAPRPAALPPAEVRDVAEAIGRMRESAAVR